MKYEKKIILRDGRTCVIRNGIEDDAEAVLSVFILTHAQTDFLASYPEESKHTIESEKEYLKASEENERQAFLVAEVDGAIVATAGISCVKDSEKARHRAEFGVSVDKAYWRLGIGRALTESCIECARAAGYAQIELEVVSENERAIPLYKSAGFVEYGRNPKAFRSRTSGWQENVLMRLDLTE